MQPQIYPSGVVPSDKVLVKSLYKQLLKDKWELRYKPAHDDPEEYGLPSGHTGNSIVRVCWCCSFLAPAIHIEIARRWGRKYARRKS